MRLGGRLQAAIDILEEIITRHRPVPEAVKDWGISHRFAGSGDRAAINNLVLDALRKRRSHAARMDDESPSALVIAVALFDWTISPAELAVQCEGDRHAPRLPDRHHLDAALFRSIDDAPAAVRADLPDWVKPDFEEAFGADWIAEGAALAARAPLDLRVNTLLATREQAKAALAHASPVETRFAPSGLRIAAGEGAARQMAVTSEVSFARGFFEVQDEGSQLAATLSGVQPGETVLDYCAGGGGKTLAFAAMMENTGTIHAFDADRRRLAPMVERLRRNDVKNVELHERAASLEPLVGTIDRVFIDAPCSGTGTWRRRPDAKWRLSDRNAAERTRDQDQVLDEASRFVCPDGELVYVTCSLLPRENTGRVEAFLARNPDFRVIDPAPRWQALLKDAPLPAAQSGPGLLFSPNRTGTDGFYVALMQRRA